MYVRKRIEYIDIAKGISIICIILGHLHISYINHVVFTFHVPIFFLISGMLFSGKNSWRVFIKKRIHSLIVPYIVTSLTVIIIGAIKALQSGGLSEVTSVIAAWGAAIYGAGDEYFEPFYIKSIGAIWFLLAMFWANIFLKAVLKIKHQIIVVLLLFFMGVYSREIMWMPFSIQAGCCALLFLYIGYLIKNTKPYILDSRLNMTRLALRSRAPHKSLLAS